MNPPEGYEIVKDGDIELGDLILDGALKGWHEPYIIWIGKSVSNFKGVARRVGERGGNR